MKQNNFKKYGLSTSDLSFSNKEVKVFGDISGKNISNVKRIFTKFFKNPYSITALFIFFAIFITSIIVPIISPYTELGPISSAKSSILSFLRPTWMSGGYNYTSIFDANDAFLKDLINAKIVDESFLEDFVKVNGANLLLKYNPWNYLNQIDNQNHFSILGTDPVGRDIWTRLWIGTRKSILLGVSVALIVSMIGILFGSILGFNAGTKFDNIAMRIVEMFNTLPSIIMLIILTFVLQSSFLSIFLSIIIILWPSMVSQTRVFIIKTKNLEFIDAARSIGVKKRSLIFYHALPNVIGKLMPTFFRAIISVMVLEASLAFFGITNNVQAASLGSIINDAKGSIEYWWYLFSPALVILLLTLSLQLIANGLHDAFEPQKK